MIKPRLILLSLSFMLVLNNANANSFSSVLSSLLSCLKKNSLEESINLAKLKNANSLLISKHSDGNIYLIIDAEKVDVSKYISTLGQSINSVEQELAGYNSKMEQIISSVEAGESVDFVAMESSFDSFKEDKATLENFLNTSSGIAKYKEFLTLINKAKQMLILGTNPQGALDKAMVVVQSIELTPDDPSNNTCKTTEVMPVYNNNGGEQPKTNVNTNKIDIGANNSQDELTNADYVEKLINEAFNNDVLDQSLDMLSKAYVYADGDIQLVSKIKLAEVALMNSLKTQLVSRISKAINIPVEIITDDAKILFAINYFAEELNGKVNTAELTTIAIGTEKNNFKDGLITYQAGKVIETLIAGSGKDEMTARLAKLKILVLGNNDFFILPNGDVDVVSFLTSTPNISLTGFMFSGLKEFNFNTLKTELPALIDKIDAGQEKYDLINKKLEKIDVRVRSIK